MKWHDIRSKAWWQLLWMKKELNNEMNIIQNNITAEKWKLELMEVLM